MNRNEMRIDELGSFSFLRFITCDRAEDRLIIIKQRGDTFIHVSFTARK